jgi:DMSO/TMAO reductase YedYZ molybdopterin-dependent catalytic subunit
MFRARAAYQVRTLPERLVEWLLLFVPLDAFEAGLRVFGPQAKVYALYGAVAVMAGTLAAGGAVVLRRRWPPAGILALALALYLLAVAVVLPLTGAGPFGTGLFQDPLVVNSVYLAAALAYGAVLLLGTPRAPAPAGAAPPGRATAPAGRRGLFGAFLAAAGGAAAASLLAWRRAAGGGGGSSLPLARLPAAGAAAPAATPTAHPGMPGPPAVLPEAPPATQPAPPDPVAGASADPDAVPSVAEAPAAADALAAAAVPAAPAAPALARDQNGALEAAARARGELAGLLTPPGAHYVVTKNAVADPELEAETWRLVLDGEVQRPVQVDYATLRRLPPVELVKTLECISNFTSMCELAAFGCDLISTARWTGARLRDVLDLAGGLRPGVVSLQVQGADEFSSAIPPALALDPDALLAYEMDGRPLPRRHGFPVRLLVPGRYGMKNAKWVIAIRALRTEHVDWYGQRNWNRQGVVKTMSRIDAPADGARLPPGRHRIAGIAYAGDRGINGVQFSSDGGRTWNPAVFLEPAPGRDAWVRWQGEFDLAPGQRLTLTARAFDGQGQVQSSVFRLPQPDGGSGLPSIGVGAA